MDWDHIRAIDLFHVFRSFLPNDSTSAILKVSIIPSMYGLEKMNKENVQGPEGIWNDLESSDEDEELGTLGPLTRKQLIRKDQEAFDQEKLRKYQKDRLKYYFAVVECSSKETSMHLYNSCNDLEIEHTSNRFDMRFIPDDVKFDASQIPKDVANSAPVDHKLPEFHTKSLQHTRVKLTWDQDDPERLSLTKRLRDESLYSDNAYLPLAEERKLKKYLATSDSESSDDSSDEEDDSKKKAKRKKVRKKYSSLLNEIHHTDNGSMFGKGNTGDGNMDMEITFTPGITDSVQSMVDRKLNNNEDKSSWEQHLEKLKEKKHTKRVERKLKLQQQKKEEIEEREKRKKERRKKKKSGVEDEIDPELALLVSGGKKSTLPEGDNYEDDGEVDPRFGGVVTNPKDFGFDRTNPQYKASSSFVKKVHKKRALLKKEDKVISIILGSL